MNKAFWPLAEIATLAEVEKRLFASLAGFCERSTKFIDNYLCAAIGSDTQNRLPAAVRYPLRSVFCSAFDLRRSNAAVDAKKRGEHFSSLEELQQEYA